MDNVVFIKIGTVEKNITYLSECFLLSRQPTRSLTGKRNSRLVSNPLYYGSQNLNKKYAPDRTLPFEIIIFAS